MHRVRIHWAPLLLEASVRAHAIAAGNSTAGNMYTHGNMCAYRAQTWKHEHMMNDMFFSALASSLLLKRSAFLLTATVRVINVT